MLINLSEAQFAVRSMRSLRAFPISACILGVFPWSTNGPG
jgi:hypothetical protein